MDGGVAGQRMPVAQGALRTNQRANDARLIDCSDVGAIGKIYQPVFADCNACQMKSIKTL